MALLYLDKDPTMNYRPLISTILYLLIPLNLAAQEWALADTWDTQDRQEFDHFGSAIASDGEYVAVGSFGHDFVDTSGSYLESAGAVYIFKQNPNESYSFIQKLTASDRAEGDLFGEFLAIDGSHLLIGAPGVGLGNKGAAYIFERQPNGLYEELQKLEASDGEDTDEFGTAVAISGDYVVIGAEGHRFDENGQNLLDDAGAAYMFKRNSSSGLYEEESKVVAAHRQSFARFGFRVGISGNQAVVGTTDDDFDQNGGNSLPGAGSAHVFARNQDGDWELVVKLVASDRKEFVFFGREVAMDGDLIAVGSTFDYTDAAGNNLPAQSGSVYVFQEINPGQWEEIQKLTAQNSNGGQWFGYQLNIDQERLLISAVTKDIQGSTNVGAAYIFDREGSGPWEQSMEIFPETIEEDLFFAYDLDLVGDHVFIAPFNYGLDANGENFLEDAGVVFHYYNGILSTDSFELMTDIVVWPNPSEGTIQLSQSNSQGPLKVKLMDLSGRVLWNGVVSDAENQLSIDGPAGIYLLEYTDGLHRSGVTKIIKY